MFYQLPPAGNTISCGDQHCDIDYIAELLPSNIYFFNSGAASLAAAIQATVQHSNVEQPEVLLPAYACPELVSAILFTGAKPVLVDLDEDRTWMDLTSLSAKLTRQTCAVIAVNLFGIPERLDKIRQVLHGRPISLIVDSAQAFPETKELLIEQGDLVIYSFGRGKPISVLGGGAVLAGNTELADQVARIYHSARANNSNSSLFRMKIKLYNHLISPRLYWLLNILPFTQLGATIYHPLSTLNKMDKSGLRLLKENIEMYWLRGQDQQNAITNGIANRGSNSIIDLGTVSDNGKIPRLLRYPLLAKNPKTRDELYESLNHLGLGASKMYPTTLQYIGGLEHLFSTCCNTPNADSFSKRILTLPIHSGVRVKDISKMLDLIC